MVVVLTNVGQDALILKVMQGFCKSI